MKQTPKLLRIRVNSKKTMIFILVELKDKRLLLLSPNFNVLYQARRRYQKKHLSSLLRYSLKRNKEYNYFVCDKSTSDLLASLDISIKHRVVYKTKAYRSLLIKIIRQPSFFYELWSRYYIFPVWRKFFNPYIVRPEVKRRSTEELMKKRVPTLFKELISRGFFDDYLELYIPRNQKPKNWSKFFLK